MTELSEGLLAYHQRSKHRVDRYAPGPTGLDWANQPDPFREFHGAAQLKLPLAADSLETRYNELRLGNLLPARRFDLDQSGRIVRALARAVGVEILRRQQVGTALQPFQRQSASDRGLSAMPASSRPVRRGLSLPEPGPCTRTTRRSRRSAMDCSVFRQRSSDRHQLDSLARSVEIRHARVAILPA